MHYVAHAALHLPCGWHRLHHAASNLPACNCTVHGKGSTPSQYLCCMEAAAARRCTCGLQCEQFPIPIRWFSTGAYTEANAKAAEAHQDFVMGFISQGPAKWSWGPSSPGQQAVVPAQNARAATLSACLPANKRRHWATGSGCTSAVLPQTACLQTLKGMQRFP